MLLAALAVTAALVLVWVRVVRTLTEQVERRPPIGQPRAIVWNDRVFTTDLQLKRYLDSKSVSYTRWVSKHPAAFAVIQHKLPASATATRVSKRSAASKSASRSATKQAKPAPKVPERPTEANASTAPRRLAEGRAGSSSGPSSTTVVVVALVGVETLLFLLAFLPARLGPMFLRRFYAVPERRFGVLAGALAILFGLLLSFYLS